MTDHPEFRPIETVPSRRVWPYALLGAVLVSGLVFAIARHSSAASAQATTPQAVAALSPKIDTTQAAQTLPLPVQAAVTPKAPEGPNVLGAAAVEKMKSAAVTAVQKTKAAARGELDREVKLTKGAQKQVEAYKKQNAELQKELDQARAEITAMQEAKKGPPPTDQEKILQMLAPVLKTSSNDGRP
jgi:hypothetical protein